LTLFKSNVNNLQLSDIGKPAKLSSQYNPKGAKYSFDADKAVDGIYISPTLRASMAHSKEELKPWWRVDLVNIYCVWAVNILNRVESKYSKFQSQTADNL